MRLSIAVLAGGRSRRMGFDKATLRLPDQRTLLERQLEVARALGPVEIILSCRRDQLLPAPPGVVRAYDDGDTGPLGGLVAALEVMRGDALLALAVDLVGIDRRLLAAIAAAAFDGIHGIMTRTDRGIEPFASLYPRESLVYARAQLHPGLDLSLRTLARSLVDAGVARWRDADPWDREQFKNVNRMSDLRSAVAPAQAMAFKRRSPPSDRLQSWHKAPGWQPPSPHRSRY